MGATAVLAACGTEPDDDRDPFEPAPPAEDPGAPEGSNGDADGDEDGGGGEVLASAEDIEVGGGLIVADQNVVVTQPTEGEFRGFSAVCTHQGCLVSDIADGTINCNCHFSRFSIEDGSVIEAAEGGDPAGQDPLPEVEIEVNGSEIRLL